MANALPSSVDIYQDMPTELLEMESCQSNSVIEKLEFITRLAFSKHQAVAVSIDALITLSIKERTYIESIQHLNEGITDVIWDGLRFVAISAGGTIMVKDDSNSWQIIETNITSNVRFFQEIMFHKGIYYAVGYNAVVQNIPGVDGEGFIYYSQDLAHWQEISINESLLLNGSSNWSKGDLLYISSQGFSQVILINGPEQFKILDHNDGRVESYFPPFKSITSDGAEFLLLGLHGFIGKSEDGAHWTGRSVRDWSTLQSVVWGEPGYIAVGMKGKIYHSLKGDNWEEVESGTSLHLLDIIWAHNSYIAVGGDFIENDYSQKTLSSKSKGIILSSKDGRHWERVSCAH